MMASLPPVRRIVTGHDAQGRAIIAADGALPTVVELKAVPGTVFHEIWNTPTAPAPVDNGADPTTAPLQLHPAPLGSVIRIVDIPPDGAQSALSSRDAAAAFAEIGAADAGTGEAHESRHRLMHRTETVDYGIVLSGKVWLVVDEGETELFPGDVVVQRGTNHAWSNRSDATARMAFILIDGRFADGIR